MNSKEMTEMFKSNDVPNLYTIKYWNKNDPKKVMFGVVNPYDKEQKKIWKTHRHLLIEDAVKGTVMRCPFAEMGLEKMSYSDEYDTYVEAEYNKAMKLSKKAGKGVKVNKIFAIGVGDGNAFYIVTKIGKSTVEIEWRSFQGDRWVDSRFGYGGSFKKKDIERFVTAQEAMAEIFGEIPSGR